MRTGIYAAVRVGRQLSIPPVVVLALAATLAPLALADGGGYVPPPEPINAIAIGIGLLAMTVLGSLLLFILGVQEDHRKRGR